MKYIIAFVLLGLVTYAGAFMLVSGIRQSLESSRAPSALTDIPPQNYTDGMSVSAKIDRQFGKMTLTTTVYQDFFGVKIGDPIVQHYYVIPAGEVLKPSEQYYMLICVTDEEDKEALDSFFSMSLDKAGSETPLECEGILTEMKLPFVNELEYLLAYNGELIGYTGVLGPTLVKSYNHICQYTFFVQRNNGGETLPIIVGAALTVVGAGCIVLLAVKKHRENSGY